VFFVLLRAFRGSSVRAFRGSSAADDRDRRLEFFTSFSGPRAASFSGPPEAGLARQSIVADALAMAMDDPDDMAS
jgi:hypothetical protein